MQDEIFTDDFLKEIGFERQTEYVSENFHGEKTKRIVSAPYGRAIDLHTKGMTVLTWNTEGHSCTYFGEKLAPNISFGIGKDGGTRMAFNGYIFTQDDVRKALSLTW